MSKKSGQGKKGDKGSEKAAVQPGMEHDQDNQGQRLTVVGIGASAGGIEALIPALSSDPAVPLPFWEQHGRAVARGDFAVGDCVAVAVAFQHLAVAAEADSRFVGGDLAQVFARHTAMDAHAVVGVRAAENLTILGERGQQPAV